MAPRTRRRRRSQRQSNGTSTNGTATTLLAQVTDLVAENRSLVRENRELQSIVARVSQAVKGVSPGSVTRTRGGGAGSQHRTTARPRQRRRITDPATLERRRAALAKARQVLAERRASSKAGS
jgi:hypothetical protein